MGSSCWFKEFCHTCHSRIVLSCRWRASGCTLRHHFAFGFHVAPQPEQEDRRQCSAAPGEQQVCTRVALSLLSHLRGRKSPRSLLSAVGSLWRVRIHNPVSFCLHMAIVVVFQGFVFSFLPSPFHVEVRQDAPPQRACSPLLMSIYFLFSSHTVKAGCFVKQTG